MFTQTRIILLLVFIGLSKSNLKISPTYLLYMCINMTVSHIELILAMALLVRMLLIIVILLEMNIEGIKIFPVTIFDCFDNCVPFSGETFL